MISRTLWICLIVVKTSIKNPIPNRCKAAVVADILGVMEVMVGSVGDEWHQSEDAPWEFVAGVAIKRLKCTKETPEKECKTMNLVAQEENTCVEWEVIRNGVL